MADEPTGNLDPASSDTVITALREHATAGACVVIATHDPGPTPGYGRRSSTRSTASNCPRPSSTGSSHPLAAPSLPQSEFSSSAALGNLISGAVVTERIFGLPGFGKLTIDAVFQRDYPVIQGVVLVTATAYITINFAVDMLYSLIDPRIRVGGEPP